MRILQNLLKPPFFPGNLEKNETARLMNSMGWYFALVLVIAATIYIPLFVQQKTTAWIVILALFVSWRISRLFLFRGKLLTAGLVTVTSGWIVCVCVAFVSGGINSPMMFAVAAISIAVGLLFPKRIGTLYLVINILTGFCLAYWQEWSGGISGTFENSPLGSWFFFAFSLIFTNWAINMTVREMQTTLARSRRENEARKLAEQTLRESESRYSHLHKSMRDGFAMVDMEGRYLEFNEAFREMLGYSEEELLALTYSDITPEAWHDFEQKIVDEQIFSNGYSQVYEKEYRRKDGSVFPVELRALLVRDEKGNPRGIWATARDITQRKHVEKAEREHLNLAEALISSASAINSTLNLNEVLDRVLDNVGQVVPHDAANIMLLDADSEILLVMNSRGYGEGGLLFDSSAKIPLSSIPILEETAMNKRPLLLEDTRTSADWVTIPEKHWIRSYVAAPILIRDKVAGFLNLDSATPGFFTTGHAGRLQAFADQAAVAIENARLYEKVQKLAITDVLTGTYNRVFFEAELSRMEMGRDFPVSIVVADLDNLKNTNDKHGHAVGDELIKGAASILQAAFRASDIISRIGGDEFAILLPKTDAVTRDRMLARVRAKMAEHNEQHPQIVSLSIGACTAKQTGLMDAFIVADRRMYADKAARKAAIPPHE